MIAAFRLPRAEREILGSARLSAVTPWILAAMTFAIVVVAAGALLVAKAGRTIERSIESRYTIVVPAGHNGANTLAPRLADLNGVTAVRPVSESDLRDLLAQWLGAAAANPDLPVPTMIDVDIDRPSDLPRLREQLRRMAPEASLTSHGAATAPLANALTGLRWTGLLLILLLSIAAGSAVVLAARGALVSHRSTIDVLHGIGATDAQVARLFVRRIALDTLIGSAVGAAGAAVAIALLASSAQWLGEFGGVSLGLVDLAVLGLVPLLLTLAATWAARTAIVSALEREL